MLHRLAVDQAAERTRVRRHAGGQQRADLVEQSRLELLVDPPGETIGEPGRRHAQRDGANGDVRR